MTTPGVSPPNTGAASPARHSGIVSGLREVHIAGIPMSGHTAPPQPNATQDVKATVPESAAEGRRRQREQ